MMMTMSKIKSLVVDTTFLDAMYRLDLLENVTLLCDRVYVPENVEKEFLNDKNEDKDKRFSYLIKKFKKYRWLKKCNSYDKGVLLILSADKKIHLGESEVIAQVKQLGLGELQEDFIIAVLDDRCARNSAENMNIKKMGTLRVLAKFHLIFSIIDYYSKVDFLVKNGARFTRNVVRMVFEEVEKEILSGDLELSESI